MAYNNKIYNKYTKHADIIIPHQSFPKITDIQKIEPEQSIQPYYAYQGLHDKREAYNKALQNNKKETETFLANYNDPTELNSYIDALTNREAVSKKFGKTWGTLSTVSGTVAVLSLAGSIVAAALAPFTGGATAPLAAGLVKAGAVAALPAIPAATDVTINKGVKPIIKGKPKEALVNTFINLGETMDFAANPVKGFVLEGPEGFVKGSGLAKGGRVNYDYDTDSFLADMLLETITDPLNWVDLGTGIALKNTTKSIAKQATTQVVDNTITAVNANFKGTLKSITAEGAERISKKVTNATAQVAREWSEANFKKLNKVSQDLLIQNGRNKIQRALVQALKEELPEATNTQLNLILRKAGRSSVTQRFTSSASKAINNFQLDTLSSNVIKSLSGVQHYSDNFQRFMTKGAMFTSGYGLGVEAAKYGWKGTQKFINNITINRLEKFTYFDKKNGINPKYYTKAKNIWEASYNYANDLLNQKSQHDMLSFYTFMNQQLNRDKQLISQILQSPESAIKKAAQLDAQFIELYGYSFAEYIKYIQQIDLTENGLFTEYAKYANDVSKILNIQAGTKPLTNNIMTGAKLFKIQDLEAQNIIKQVQNVLTKQDVQSVEKLYTIKLNNAYVHSLLINDPQINQVLEQIYSDQSGIGVLCNKIIGDLNSLAPEVAAQIPDAVRVIKETGQSFFNIKNLYNDIAGLPIQKIKGISDTDFKKYIIDQIFNSNKTPAELLAEFDDITMPSLKNGLEVMLYESDFKFKDYPLLEEQIAGAYKRFLEAQKTAGIDNIGATIAEDFTKSVTDLVTYLPDYADELAELTMANDAIRAILSRVKETNSLLLDSILTDKLTIFNTRKLTDAGLALKTVALKENLAMFNLDTSLSGNVVQSADILGRRINRDVQNLKQYEVIFSKEKQQQINKAYKKFRQTFIDNKDFKEVLEQPAFRYIKDTNDTYEQLAQLIEFNKLSKDKITNLNFKGILKKDLSKDLYWNVIDPSQLFTTDFAWEAMAQSAWIAEKQFNEGIINGITAYKNLSVSSRKIAHDFQATRDLLSTNKIDRPKMLQQERYLKVITPMNNMLEFLEKTYTEAFDTALAKDQIEHLRGILNDYPDLAKKYNNLVDELEAYWNGEKTFRQAPKELKGSENYVDEFTPFWQHIEEMNAEISNVITETNKNSSQKKIYTKVTPWDPVKKQQALNKAISKATNANAKGALYNLFNTPENITNELAYRFRFITFDESDISDPQLNGMFKKFTKQLPEEVKLVHDEASHRYWLVLDKNQKLNKAGQQVYINGNPITRLQNKKQFNEFQLVDDLIDDEANPGITKTLNELDDTLETLTGKHLGDSQGEVLTKKDFEVLYDSMPEEVKVLLPDKEEWLDQQFFENCVFNESVLGSASSKRSLGMRSSNVIVNARNALTITQNYLKPKNEYVNTVFDSQLSISSPNSIWNNFTDEELLEALQSTSEYSLMVTATDKKYGLKAREIIPTSVEHIKKAKELGGWIVPRQVAKDMYNVLNHRAGSTGFAKLWSRIMYAYKFGYLCRPGAWIRNFIDTNLKSKLEMGDEFASYKAQAHKILDEVDSIKKYVLARDAEGVIKSDAIKEWFEKGYAKHLTYEQFLELDYDFLSQGISGNIMADLFKTEGGDIWNTFTELTGNIIEGTNKTENYNRLAMYLYELDKGNDYTTALSKLAKTHFDYSYKSKAEQLVDLVFPFTTFTLRNFSYWVETVNKHPWIMRNYVHLMQPHWDFKDYTPEELARDKRVQTQILYGQLKLKEFNDKVITFKANPSIQDAIQMFSDPINNVYDKLAAPIAYPINKARGEYANPTNLVPMFGPAIQATKTMLKTGSPIPSAIGVNKKYKRSDKVNFKNKNLKDINSYTNITYRTPKYRNNIVYDSYRTKGITQYRANMFPVIDIAHDIKMRYSTNVYNKIKNRVQQNVFRGVQYRIRLDANLFR